MANVIETMKDIIIESDGSNRSEVLGFLTNKIISEYMELDSIMLPKSVKEKRALILNLFHITNFVYESRKYGCPKKLQLNDLARDRLLNYHPAA